MKIIAIISVLVIVTGTWGYTTKYDHMDPEEILSNLDIAQFFFDCFNDKIPCNELTQTFKNNFPEVVQEACAKCNPTQKQKLKIFLDGVKEKLPTEYADLKKMLDPEGKLFVALEEALAKA